MSLSQTQIQSPGPGQDLLSHAGPHTAPQSMESIGSVCLIFPDKHGVQNCPLCFWGFQCYNRLKKPGKGAGERSCPRIRAAMPEDPMFEVSEDGY